MLPYYRVLNPLCHYDALKADCLNEIESLSPRLIAEDDDPMFWQHCLQLHCKIEDDYCHVCGVGYGELHEDHCSVGRDKFFG